MGAIFCIAMAVATVLVSCKLVIGSKDGNEGQISARQHAEQNFLISGYEIYKICRMGLSDNGKIVESNSYFAIMKSNDGTNNWAVHYYELKEPELKSESLALLVALEMSEQYVDGLIVLGAPSKKIRVQYFSENDSSRMVFEPKRKLAFGSDESSKVIAEFNTELPHGVLYLKDPDIPNLHSSGDCRSKL